MAIEGDSIPVKMKKMSHHRLRILMNNSSLYSLVVTSFL